MIRLALIGVLALLLAGCAGPQPSLPTAVEAKPLKRNGDGMLIDPADPVVLIGISNAQLEPLQCRVQFGHWVDRDLGTIEMGSNSPLGKVFVKVQRQKDGALYVMRDDGQRRMMVENIFCARKDHWQATVGQVNLDAVRQSRWNTALVSCAWPEVGGRVVCFEPTLLNTIE
jgi:hypothetical protein